MAYKFCLCSLLIKLFQSTVLNNELYVRLLGLEMYITFLCATFAPNLVSRVQQLILRGIYLHKWYISTQVVYIYTSGIYLHKWYIATQVVYSYTSGIYLHKWYIATQVVYSYTSGI
jgi:hypothetical protein